jgi:hypothetical protein
VSAVARLYELAKQKDIPGRSRMGKWDLIEGAEEGAMTTYPPDPEPGRPEPELPDTMPGDDPDAEPPEPDTLPEDPDLDVPDPEPERI